MLSKITRRLIQSEISDNLFYIYLEFIKLMYISYYQSLTDTDELMSSEEIISSQQSFGSIYNPSGRGYEKQNVRGHIDVMTDDVVGALDRCKVSPRNAVYLVSAIAQALGHDLNDLILNTASFYTKRAEVRKKRAEKIKILFGEKNIDSCVIHWDGKIIEDSSGKKIDKLPIAVTVGKDEKLINVASLDNGKGKTQAEAIHNALFDWDLRGSVKALCCDTTASNLGSSKGAAVFLERLLDIQLLYLPCRHHIYELVLANAYFQKLPGTTGPDVPLFKTFKKEWYDFDLKTFRNGLLNIDPNLRQKIPRIESFIKSLIEQDFTRDDYKELLELTLIFLDLVPHDKVKFKKPGAFHHARWMAKAIYSLKIYLFRDQFKLKPNEETGLLQVCQFIVFVYIEAWFTAPLAIKAPNNDLKFIKILWEYREIDSALSETSLKKFKNHLWYLSPEASALSFFDSNISTEVKKNMILALTPERGEENYSSTKKFEIKNENMLQLVNQEMDYFITPETVNFFERFNINTDFLQVDVDKWENHISYLQGLELSQSLQVVNDVAERFVHLVEEYSKKITHDEEQSKYVLEIVTEHRKRFPNAYKSTQMQSRYE